MGLLKSRKDAGKEFEKYVDAVEHPPELDDYVESEELADSDTILPGGVAANLTEIQAQLAARNAHAPGRRHAGRDSVATGTNEAIALSTEPLHRKRLGEVLVERDTPERGRARCGARRPGRVREAARRVPRRHRHPRRA